GVVQERCLADASLAADDEDRALTSSGVLQQPAQHFPLVGPASKRRWVLGGHWLLNCVSDQGGGPARPLGRCWPIITSVGCVDAHPEGRRLANRVAIVTGGSRGIGCEIARSLAGRGYAVVIDYARD